MFLELSKDELFEVMKNLVHVYSSAWFKSERLAIEKYGSDAFLSKEFLDLFRNFGSKEANGLIELSVVSGTSIDSIIKAFQLSHWALFENIELTKLSDKIARMRTIDCSRQKYARRKWGTEYPCLNLAFSHESRKGFAQAINPQARVKCNFSPPNPRPQDISEHVSCEWTITIPE
jgi:hypothetical protein